jgi:hypothetical protein
MRESIVVLSVLVEADRLIRSASDVTMQRIVMDYVFGSLFLCFSSVHTRLQLLAATVA